MRSAWKEVDEEHISAAPCSNAISSAKGTAFLALEDEGGLVNVVLKPEVYEAHRKVLRSPFVVVEGKLQRRGQAINVLARKVVAVEMREE